MKALLQSIAIACTISGAAMAATPTIVQHVSSSSNDLNGEQGNNYAFYPPNPVLAGNVLVLGVGFNDSSTAGVPTLTSITDSSGDTWSATPTCTVKDTGASNTTVAVFVHPITNAGTHKITVGFSANVLYFQYTLSEYANLNSSPINGCTTSLTSLAPNISAGAFTPTTNNDANGGNLIWAYFVNNGIPFATLPTNYAPTGSFSLLSADTSTNGQLPTAAEAWVQAASASVTPGITLTGGATDSWTGVAVALKAATAGNVPAAGIHVNSIHHTTNGAPPTTWLFSAPSRGNLIVLVCTQNEVTPITGVTDNHSNTYTKFEPQVDEPQFWYAANASTGGNLKLTVTSTAAGLVNSSCLVYDIGGASAQDGGADLSGSGISAGSNTISNAPSITPTSTGLTLSAISYGTGPSDDFAAGAPTGAVFDYVFYTGETDQSRMDNADGRAHFYNSNLSAENWNWHVTHTVGTTAAASAVHFSAASTISGPLTTTTLGFTPLIFRSTGKVQ